MLIKSDQNMSTVVTDQAQDFLYQMIIWRLAVSLLKTVWSQNNIMLNDIVMSGLLTTSDEQLHQKSLELAEKIRKLVAPTFISTFQHDTHVVPCRRFLNIQ